MENKPNLKHARTRSYNHIVDQELHVAYKSFVKEAENLPCLVALENLLLDEFNRSKKSNKRDSMWVRSQLIKRITEALNWKGISYVLVDPAYISQTCSKCSHVDSNNRNGKTFVCTVCKYSCDADYNAAVNIGERAYDEELKGIVETYKCNKKLRHTHIRELLQKRHSSYMKSLASV